MNATPLVLQNKTSIYCAKYIFWRKVDVFVTIRRARVTFCHNSLQFTRFRKSDGNDIIFGDHKTPRKYLQER